MIEKLCPSKEFPWANTKRGISMNDFTANSRMWLTIICIQVSPCTHMIVVLDLRAPMVAILDNISLTIGRLMISYIKFFKNHGGINLLFPSLIIKLCRRVRVVEYPTDTWVCLGTPIYPFKFRVKVHRARATK